MYAHVKTVIEEPAEWDICIRSVLTAKQAESKRKDTYLWRRAYIVSSESS